MTAVVDLAGQKFGWLTVMRRDTAKPKGLAWWVCRCRCGTVHSAAGNSLRKGRTVSCGCYRRTVSLGLAQDSQTKHGLHNSTEYSVWRGMKKRCLYKKHPAYPNYGGRGVTICKRWLDSFEAFYEDMGKRPSPEHSLDRRDNDGNYTPGNCIWSTRQEQANNKRSNVILTVGGEARSIAQWAKATHQPATRLYKRAEAGWAPHEIVYGRSTPC